MTDEFRSEMKDALRGKRARLRGVLLALGIAVSSWYYKPRTSDGERRVRQPTPTPPEVVAAVVKMATDNPWYGYKRIAVMCRRKKVAVTDRQAYRVMRAHGLLQKRKRSRRAELHQTAKLYELLPSGPNGLWQMDVTYTAA